MIDKRFFKNNGPFSLGQIAQMCDATLFDDAKKDIKVCDIANMKEAVNGEICSFYDKKAREDAASIKATACITTADLASFVSKDVVILISENPKLSAWKLNCAFYEEFKPETRISDKASIHPTAKIGANCSIADFVAIGENVEIGDNCIIEPNATIAKGCIIGNNCRIAANASISYCVMGSNCYIYTGARIGQDGFGFITLSGQHKRIPQIGIVVIGNDVEIGANTCIDRGALDNTIIGDGTKIDNMVQIAHGDKTGKGCIFVALTGISGSVTFGDYVVVGGQVGIADHLTIGSGAQIASQSGIMKNVAPGEILLGTPAVPFRDAMKQAAYLQRAIKKTNK